MAQILSLHVVFPYRRARYAKPWAATRVIVTSLSYLVRTARHATR